MTNIRFQFRADTAANWTSNDPTLAMAEVGYETDTDRFKVGDGTTAWTSLGYYQNALLSGTVDPTTEGVDGDFYIRTDTSTIFGPKASGTWPTGVSLIGADGSDGDDGEGVPTGGTSGQVLAKVDGTDFNTEWVDPPAGYTDSDVDAHLNQSSATTDQVLSWDGADYAWVAQIDAIDDLSDVDTSTAAPTDGQVLTWVDANSAWEPADAPAGYADADVDTHLNQSSATAGQVLSWDGADYTWINAGGGSADGEAVRQYGYPGALEVNTGDLRLYTASDVAVSYYAYLGTTSSSGDVEVDVLVNGVVEETITIAASATSATGSFANDLSADDYLTIDITSAGTGAADLYIVFVLTGA